MTFPKVANEDGGHDRSGFDVDPALIGGWVSDLYEPHLDAEPMQGIAFRNS